MSKEYTFKIYFGGVPLGCSHKELSRFFKQYGDLKQLFLAKDSAKKKSIGHGFVLCNDYETYAKILKAPTSLRGVDFYVDKAIINEGAIKDPETRKRVWAVPQVAKSRSEKSAEKSLKGTEESLLLQAFTKFGITTSCDQIRRKIRGRHLSLLEVGYENIEAANLARKAKFMQVGPLTLKLMPPSGPSPVTSKRGEHLGSTADNSPALRRPTIQSPSKELGARRSAEELMNRLASPLGFSRIDHSPSNLAFKTAGPRTRARLQGHRRNQFYISGTFGTPTPSSSIHDSPTIDPFEDWVGQENPGFSIRDTTQDYSW